MYKAIIFDFFGVIVGKGFENTYRAAGGDPVKDHDFINDMLGQANLGLIDESEFNQAMENKLKLDQDHWQQVIRQADFADKKLLTLISQLHKNYKTAILSNSNKGVINRRVEKEWLEQNLDQIIVSADVGLVKPDLAIYRLAADRLGVLTEECIFIDDRQPFVEAATKTGMTAITYKGLNNLKGELDKLFLGNLED